MSIIRPWSGSTPPSGFSSVPSALSCAASQWELALAAARSRAADAAPASRRRRW
ncbi:hypothetical protein [Phytohabitans suffuscus]|uniref:hypothetical protein n=1 Tax=Phytohabitans suffuscus TaxID=624315 RepID=UPI0018D5EB36|nr:hypothetical protein [Phytohabitans suffuscus]